MLAAAGLRWLPRYRPGRCVGRPSEACRASAVETQNAAAPLQANALCAKQGPRGTGTSHRSLALRAREMKSRAFFVRLDGACKAVTLKISHIVCTYLQVVRLGFHIRDEKQEA